MTTSCTIVGVSSGIVPYNVEKPSYDFLLQFWNQHCHCMCYYCQQHKHGYSISNVAADGMMMNTQSIMHGQPSIHVKVNPKLLMSDYPSLIATDKSDNNEEIEDKRKTTVPLKCQVCGKAYKHKSRLEKHVQGCRGGRACEVCGKLLNTERAVEDHMRNVHRDTIFPCGNCNRTFKTNSALTLHTKRMHTPFENQYPCTQCDKAFGCAQSLKRHLDNHDPTKRWNCNLCGVSFQSSYNLRRHCLMQHVRKTLRCRECGSFCETLHEWWHHVQSHVKKKYPCVECPISFNNYKNLKRHSLVHTTQKSFHCGLCDKSFKLKKSLEHHQMHRHQRVRGYACTRCHKRFSRNSVLTVHLKTHSEKTFHCQLNNCTASFHAQYRLARHVALHHNEYFQQTRRLRAASTRDEYKMIRQSFNSMQNGYSVSYSNFAPQDPYGTHLNTFGIHYPP